MTLRESFSKVLALAVVLTPWLGCGGGHRDFSPGDPSLAGDGGESAGGAPEETSGGMADALGGHSQCVDGGCSAICDPGFHACADDSCAPDDDKTKCTSTCTACPDVTNGTAACSDNICITEACDADFHVCPDGSCARDSDQSNCTSACTPCPQLPNAEVPSCVDNACVTECRPGFKLCNGQCVDPSLDPTCGGPRLAAGAGWACAIKSEGTVWCWASDAAPTLVEGVSSVIQVTVGDKACGLKSDGTLWCWSLAAPVTPPTDVSGGMKFRQVAAGPGGTSNAICAVATSNKVYCLNGSQWQQVGTTLLATHVAVSGADAAYARANNGSIWSWAPDASPLQQMIPPGEFSQVEIAQESVVLRTSAGEVVYNGVSVGLGPFAGATFVQVSAGLRGGCALSADQRIGCWGYGAYYQLGDGVFHDSEDMVQFGPDGSKWTEVARGQLWTCALKFDGTVWCVGDHTGTVQDGTLQQVNITLP